MNNLTGNILLAAAFVAYIGPFSADYRDAMLKKWISRCLELKIPTS
jgi:dynein heavy chain, axonemal